MNNKRPLSRVLTPTLCALGLALAFAGDAAAQIKVGVSLSATGPAASLGIPEKNTIALLPKEIGGQNERGCDQQKQGENRSTHGLILERRGAVP